MFEKSEIITILVFLAVAFAIHVVLHLTVHLLYKVMGSRVTIMFVDGAVAAVLRRRVHHDRGLNLSRNPFSA